jgi:hypothetical protein
LGIERVHAQRNLGIGDDGEHLPRLDLGALIDLQLGDSARRADARFHPVLAVHGRENRFEIVNITLGDNPCIKRGLRASRIRMKHLMSDQRPQDARRDCVSQIRPLHEWTPIGCVPAKNRRRFAKNGHHPTGRRSQGSLTAIKPQFEFGASHCSVREPRTCRSRIE